MDIVIQADSENDQCYLAFDLDALGAATAVTSKSVNDDITLDFDCHGRLIGLDVVNASRVLPGAKTGVHGDAIVGVKEAAAIAGVQRSNFVRDYARSPGFPLPLAELATGRIWLRSQVEEYLAARKTRAG